MNELRPPYLDYVAHPKEPAFISIRRRDTQLDVERWFKGRSSLKLRRLKVLRTHALAQNK